MVIASASTELPNGTEPSRVLVVCQQSVVLRQLVFNLSIVQSRSGINVFPLILNFHIIGDHSPNVNCPLRRPVQGKETSRARRKNRETSIRGKNSTKFQTQAEYEALYNKTALILTEPSYRNNVPHVRAGP